MGHSRSDEAINLAVQGRWEEALIVNQEILEVSPNDIDALNRLGKAFSELGRIEDARHAYQRVIETSHTNGIARKNLERLSNLSEDQVSSKESQGIDPRFFIEESSKTRRVNVRNLAPKESLVKLAPGEPVSLRIVDDRLEVISSSGEHIGEVDPRIGRRLIKLIEGGNEYKAVVVNLSGEEIKIIVRETYQHPSQAGYPSFPPPKTSEEIRPYLKDSMVKRDIDEELPDDHDDDDGDIAGDSGSQHHNGMSFIDDPFAMEDEDMDKVI